MKKEMKSIIKKTAKIAGVTCAAAGAVALVTSKAALDAILKGGEYLKDAVKEIIDEEPEKDPTVDAEAVAPETPAGEAPAEAPAEEQAQAEKQAEENG